MKSRMESPITPYAEKSLYIPESPGNESEDFFQGHELENCEVENILECKLIPEGITPVATIRTNWETKKVKKKGKKEIEEKFGVKNHMFLKLIGILDDEGSDAYIVYTKESNNPISKPKQDFGVSVSSEGNTPEETKETKESEDIKKIVEATL